MIQAIIFDCFGVLITDVLEAEIAKFRDDDPQRAQEIADTVQLANRGKLPRDQSRARIAKLLGITFDAYEYLLRNGESRNEELLAYIKQLRGSYKTAMLSNIGAQSLGSRFTQAELDKHFDVVVASGLIGYAKPEPQAYEITADRLGVRLDECTFIDDREDYCDGARHVGMQAIQYESFAQMRSELEKLLHL